ncbi:hypothetical protein K469DRAFT_686555 [Zopfia rhizophila CBS 207.26]|uniref:Uncharacterized protein n=1 Tax=Zopfia rhizophila CBS 207.26 TaxID=1314779 RepID=A0A6A6EQS1_9PEZI|nr:hypothetical protein K469DRAFT_686555 [Zopfia rhizophila CBS 207.26]
MVKIMADTLVLQMGIYGGSYCGYTKWIKSSHFILITVFLDSVLLFYIFAHDPVHVNLGQSIDFRAHTNYTELVLRIARSINPRATNRSCVAINEIDKQQADPDAVKLDLGRHGIEIEDFGGEVQVVCVSGAKRDCVSQPEAVAGTRSARADWGNREGDSSRASSACAGRAEMTLRNYDDEEGPAEARRERWS